MEPQVAVLKYLGPQAWGELAWEAEKSGEQKSFLRKLLKK